MRVMVFVVSGRHFALAEDAIEEVRELVQVTPLPFAAPFVDGLVGAGGRILLQISLARRLGLEDREGEGELLVVNAQDGEVVIRVDKAITMANIEDEALTLQLGSEDPTNPIKGSFEWEAKTVVLLEANPLGLGNLPDVIIPNSQHRLVGEAEEAINKEVEDDALTCLVFEAGGERYAFPLGQVQEVYDGGDMTELPNTPPEIAGLSVLRGVPRLAFYFATLMGRVPQNPNSRLLVIVNITGNVVAFLVDGIIGIRRYESAKREVAGGGEGDIEAYLIEEDGKVTGLVSLNNLFSAKTLDSYSRYLPQKKGQARNEANQDTKRRLLTFRIGNEICAIEAGQVERVAEYKAPVKLPDEKDEITVGVVEIGGQVLPVADLRKLMRADSGHEPTAYVVVRSEKGESWALGVDGLNRLVDLSSKAIKPASTGEGDVVTEIGRLQDQLMSILNLSLLERRLTHQAEAH